MRKRRSFHPCPYSKNDHRIEQAAEGFNQLCMVMLWLGAATLLFMYSAPVSKHYTPASHNESRELSENDYLFSMATSRKGQKLSESELRNAERQMAMETRQEDVDAMKPKARAVYYASLQNSDIFSVVDK